MGWKITFNGTRRAISAKEFAEERKSNPNASQWDGGTVVDIDDLSPDEFQAIADEEDVSWVDVYNTPALTSARLQRVIVACATHAGIDPPAEPATVREFVDRYNHWLEATVPIADKPMQDGFPQTPGQPEITSPSGLPGASDGPSTSPVDSQSTTS